MHRGQAKARLTVASTAGPLHQRVSTPHGRSEFRASVQRRLCKAAALERTHQPVDQVGVHADLRHPHLQRRADVPCGANRQIYVGEELSGSAAKWERG